MSGWLIPNIQIRYVMKCPIQFPSHRWSPLYGCSAFCQLPHGLFSQRCFNNIVFFLECFPDISTKTSRYCALSNPFFSFFHQAASTISTGKFISFLTCTFFTIANDICQTQQCPFTFYFLSVQTLLWHLLTKRRQSFERNIRQERVSNEKMHDVIPLLLSAIVLIGMKYEL